MRNNFKELNKRLDEREEEIERLNNIIKNYEINTIPTLEHNIDVLVDSEDRLNNIINELEKWFKEMSEYNGLGGSDERFYYQGCLDYLKELKGSDNE